MSDENMSNNNRRKLLKTIAAGSGAVVAGKGLPESWSRPVVDSVLLPAHAQTSQDQTSTQGPTRTLVATVDLDATNQNNQATVNLPAGNYEIVPISGTYVAWNAWGNVSGCDANGENCNEGYVYEYQYSSPTIGTNNFSLLGSRYATASQALAAAQSQPAVTFSLPGTELLVLHINDSVYNDNTGGVTLEIYQIT